MCIRLYHKQVCLIYDLSDVTVQSQFSAQALGICRPFLFATTSDTYTFRCMNIHHR